MNLLTTPLKTQVLQRLIVGPPQQQRHTRVFHDFLAQGLGGVILFARDLAHCQTPEDVAKQNQHFHDSVPPHLPRPWVSIDQEGGPVARLLPPLFPEGLSPWAVGLKRSLKHQGHPTFSRHYAHAWAERLVALGFSMNFAPTLDVNLNTHNPVIGVRAFGDDPQTVWRCARDVQNACADVGLTAVGKHFPGHGNAAVDSHISLPTCTLSPVELWPFQQAIANKMPAMLIAHVYYAHVYYSSLQPPEEKNIPATCSPTIIQGLLREKLGFEGVLISDDMSMGAIHTGLDPVDAALAAVKAGVDVLLYAQVNDTVDAVVEAMVTGLQDGTLSMAQHQDALKRIVECKENTPPSPPSPYDIRHLLSPEAIATQSQQWAREGILWHTESRKGSHTCSPTDNTPLPVSSNTRLCVIEPDRHSIHHYTPQTVHAQTPCLAELLAQRSQHAERDITALSYGWRDDTIPQLPDDCDTVIMVTYNPTQHSVQQRLWQKVHEQQPTRSVLIDLGLPSPPSMTRCADSHGHTHGHISHWRPSAIKALAELLL